MESESGNDAGTRRRRGGLEPLIERSRWPLALVVVALLLLVGYVWTIRTARDAAEAAGAVAEKVGREARGIAERFRSGTITETFVSSMPELRSTGSGNLELATTEVVETFRRSEERRILWDWVSLGETVTEIRVPVTYRYHVRLTDPWELEVAGQTCIVRAPRIRPSLPPAIHTDGLERYTENGWIPFVASQQMEELERSVTPTLERYARDERRIDLVRPACRQTVAEFVRGWLLREDHWRRDRFRSIVVLFEGERESEPGAIAPTIELRPHRGASPGGRLPEDDR